MGYRYGKWKGDGQKPKQGHDTDAGFDLYVHLPVMTCWYCGGVGEVVWVLADGTNEQQRCQKCGGDGEVPGDGSMTIEPGEFGKIPSGVAVEWPAGYWGFLVGRSSTFNLGLMVNPGIIDPDYRGDLFAIVRNISNKPVKVTHGDRVAQIIPLPCIAQGIQLNHVPELTFTERGEGGFGSTGR